MRVATVGALSALLAAGLIATSHGAVSGSYQGAKFILDQRKPARPSGEVIDIDYVNPYDAAAKPPPVRRVVTTLPPGARIDTSVPDLCPASDAELMLSGEAACPAGSKVAEGEATVDTGLPGPARIVEVEVDQFNNAGELIFLNTAKGTSLRTVFRAKVTARQTVTDAPMLPGTPPDGGAIDTVHLKTFRIVKGQRRARRAYITTPRRCPKSRRWVTSIAFTYDGGVTQTVQSESPCKRKKKRKS
jgi:hypothetical protein